MRGDGYPDVSAAPGYAQGEWPVGAEVGDVGEAVTIAVDRGERDRTAVRRSVGRERVDGSLLVPDALLIGRKGHPPAEATADKGQEARHLVTPDRYRPRPSGRSR